MTRRRLSRVVLAILIASSGTVPMAGTAAAGQARQACSDPSVAGDVEEQRLTRTLGADPTPVPRRILAGAGFADLVGDFADKLCESASLSAARTTVTAHGEQLWRMAVGRAQGGATSPAQLPGGDDRGLYWARTNMTLALRQWTPGFSVSEVDRASLRSAVELASRGISDTRFSGQPGVGKLFVSGFDPFILDQEIRRGNPSGASVLALDGRTLDVGGSSFEVQAVVFPVRYRDFDQGMVEDAFRPHLVAGPQKADMITTLSQGRPDAFDLEINNGRRRSAVTGDNQNIWGGGSATAPVVPSGVGAGAEFVPTSLPTKAMRRATDQPFTVRENPAVTEIPPGESKPVVRPNGPTPGSIAVEGSGGGYLSNEVAYRSSLLRVTLGASIPGGHVHTPLLDFDSANTTRITDPVFERNRADIVTQARLILQAALAAS